MADGPSQADKVLRRAEEARTRAARCMALADDLDRLVGDGARLPPDVRARLIRIHRRTAECHLLAGTLQAAHAWRLRNSPHDGPPDFLSTVAAFAGADCAVASLFLFDHEPEHALLAASNRLARTAHGFEFAFREGPAHDLAANDQAVHAAGPALTERWPNYGEAVAQQGIHATAAVPLRLDGIRFGSLNVFSGTPFGQDLGATFLKRIADAIIKGMLLAPADDHDEAVANRIADAIVTQLHCTPHDAHALIQAQTGHARMLTARQAVPDQPTL